MFGGERFGSRAPSATEQRVIELVAQGFKNREVAQQIGTTEHVVTYGSSTTSSGFGTGSSSPSGMKPADTNPSSMPDVLESWEHSVLNLDRQELGPQDFLEH